MFFVLSANNTDTNISIKGVSTCKDGAWASMYDAFVAGLKEAFPNRTPPSAEEAERAGNTTSIAAGPASPRMARPSMTATT